MHWSMVLVSERPGVDKPANPTGTVFTTVSVTDRCLLHHQATHLLVADLPLSYYLLQEINFCDRQLSLVCFITRQLICWG
jgi:hypothetical protein